jgi:hypothetical protein
MRGSGPASTGPQLDLFYNTTHLRDKELKQRRAAAAGQCRDILRFFRENPEGYFTPFEVQKYSLLSDAPITSIRRAIHTLTQAGLLIKTGIMKEGGYGATNHTWKLS